MHPIEVVFIVFAMIGILHSIWWAMNRIADSSLPIRSELHCDGKTARIVHAYLTEKGIDNHKFHALVAAARGYFMPVYGRVLDKRPVATSFEVGKAIVAATVRGRYDGATSEEEWLRIVADELVLFRHASSPVTQSTRNVDGILF